MSKRIEYVPEPAPQAPESVGVYTQSELYRISELLGYVSENIVGVEHVAPPRPVVSQIAYADGTNWDPGSGAGLYVYKAAGWTLIV